MCCSRVAPAPPIATEGGGGVFPPLPLMTERRGARARRAPQRRRASRRHGFGCRPISRPRRIVRRHWKQCASSGAIRSGWARKGGRSSHASICCHLGAQEEHAAQPGACEGAAPEGRSSCALVGDGDGDADEKEEEEDDGEEEEEKEEDEDEEEEDDDLEQRLARLSRKGELEAEMAACTGETTLLERV